MFAFLRRRRPAGLPAASFCDACGQVCTAACRSAAHYDRVRTATLAQHIIR